MERSKLAYWGGSYYVLYEDGAYIKCHNLATAKFFQIKGRTEPSSEWDSKAKSRSL